MQSVDKNELRRYMRERLSRLSAVEISSRAERLSRALESQSVIQEAQYCMVYWELGNEVPLSYWFLNRMGKGLQFLLPKVGGVDLLICPFNEPTQVSKGAFGIYEPITEAWSPEKLSKLKNWVVLVPGVAFDRYGGRLGRGKGFYDRFLRAYPNAYPIGICYAEQVVPQVYMEGHDIRMKDIIMI